MKTLLLILAVTLAACGQPKPSRSQWQGPQRYRITTMFRTWDNVTRIEDDMGDVNNQLRRYGYIEFYSGDTLVRASGAVVVEELP